jgi:hypothetical protein
MPISATARRLMNIAVAKAMQPEERVRVVAQESVRHPDTPFGDASAAAMSVELTGTEFCVSFKENSRCNADACIPTGDGMCLAALENIPACKFDPAALCAMQIEPEGDIVQLPKLGDIDTLAAFVQASFVPLIHDFDGNQMHEEHDAQRVGKLETVAGTVL